MPIYHALVDAVPGREKEVEAALRSDARLAGVVECREKSHDFLVRFEARAFGVVDDFLQTHVRRLPGVKGVEVILDWDDFGQAVRDARARLG